MKGDMFVLTLLANKAPDEMLQEVFTADRVGAFIGAVLHYQKDYADLIEFADKRPTMLVPIMDINDRLENKEVKLSAKERQRLEQEKARLEADLNSRETILKDKLIRQLNLRRAKIARILLDHATRYLVSQYLVLESELPIRKTVTNVMQHSIELSDSIVRKIAEAEESKKK
jgi:hypothetical protein